MQCSTKITTILAIALIAMMSATTSFAIEKRSYSDFGDLENGKKIFNDGKGDVPACTGCHGPTGLGEDSMGTPRLASQGFNFLLKQLEDYASDKRTDTTMFIMNVNAKGLSPQDRRDVAAYAASLDFPMTGSDLNALEELGQKKGVRYLGKSLAQYGAPERGIPACHSCHGYNGRGAFPIYPRLTGQKYVYLVTQLKQWRDGTRKNDSMGQMRKVAVNLTDDDIMNLATFFTSTSETTLGNSRVPPQY
ncbi:MAG: c-type cytochrome [Gammaproteobacteria bacterium]|nr:c-type cytochrome [Gammaproteobacteria bacterium]